MLLIGLSKHNKDARWGRGGNQFPPLLCASSVLTPTQTRHPLLPHSHPMATPCPTPQVLTMFEKADAEYAELSGKKQILHMDKDKIQKVIGELDEKKREALHASWVKVNQDFGSVFSSLLPGTMAKLEPPEGQTFLAGLEVKVLTASLL